MEDNLVLATELYLYQNSTKVVWVGDYANNRDKYTGKLDNDDRYDKNLYKVCNELPSLQIKMVLPTELRYETFRYLVNHTKKEYIDKVRASAIATSRRDQYIIHPLPLLTYESDAGGGGDYSGDCEEWVGAWARDLISVENDAPDEEYKEIVVPFREC